MNSVRARSVVSLVPVALAALLGLAACGDGADEPVAAEATTVESSADEVNDASSAPSPERVESGTDPSAEFGASTALADLDEAADRFESAVGRNYFVVFDVVSSVSAEAGSVRVEVIDSVAVDATYPDVMTEQMLPDIPMLTVGDFFARARLVLDEGGAVEAEFDEAYGYPLTMTLDPIPDAIDDEFSIVVRSVDPIDDPVEPDGY